MRSGFPGVVVDPDTDSLVSQWTVTVLSKNQARLPLYLGLYVGQSSSGYSRDIRIDPTITEFASLSVNGTAVNSQSYTPMVIPYNQTVSVLIEGTPVIGVAS